MNLFPKIKYYGKFPFPEWEEFYNKMIVEHNVSKDQEPLRVKCEQLHFFDVTRTTMYIDGYAVGSIKLTQREGESDKIEYDLYEKGKFPINRDEEDSPEMQDVWYDDLVISKKMDDTIKSIYRNMFKDIPNITEGSCCDVQNIENKSFDKDSYVIS